EAVRHRFRARHRSHVLLPALRRHREVRYPQLVSRAGVELSRRQGPPGRERSPGRRPPLMPKALDDLRVVDLTRVIAGPFATTLLGDMGAEIIKIELPGRGDDARYGYPAVDGVPVAFLALNRNKKGITLDIRKPQGADLFRRLVGQADVVVENFAAGTM